MKLMRIYHIAVVVYLVGLSGCGHIIHWAEGNFYQGETMEPLSKVPRDYLRSAHIHHQFSTTALIDVMWLSDEVRTIYAQTYGLKNGKDDLMTKAFLRRQLEENKHFISFYVLVNFSLSVGDPNNKWALFLTAGDTNVAPNEVRITELTPEFQAFFGKRYNRFKSVYLVKFNAKTPDGKPVITDTTQIMELHFRSLEKEAVLTWQVNEVTTTPEENSVPMHTNEEQTQSEGSEPEVSDAQAEEGSETQVQPEVNEVQAEVHEAQTESSYAKASADKEQEIPTTPLIPEVHEEQITPEENEVQAQPQVNEAPSEPSLRLSRLRSME
jgi:hypothetical protein